MSVTANTAYFDSVGVGNVADQMARQMARKFGVETTTVLGKLSSMAPLPSGIKTSEVLLSPVSTFILGAKDGRLDYLVSSIAKHWGVLVGDQQKFLCHLVFQNQVDIPSNANPDSLTGKVRAVTFDVTRWDSSRTQPSSAIHVGQTRYTPYQLAEIGCSRDMACTNR